MSRDGDVDSSYHPNHTHKEYPINTPPKYLDANGVPTNFINLGVAPNTQGLRVLYLSPTPTTPSTNTPSTKG